MEVESGVRGGQAVSPYKPGSSGPDGFDTPLRLAPSPAGRGRGRRGTGYIRNHAVEFGDGVPRPEWICTAARRPGARPEPAAMTTTNRPSTTNRRMQRRRRKSLRGNASSTRHFSANKRQGQGPLMAACSSSDRSSPRGKGAPRRRRRSRRSDSYVRAAVAPFVSRDGLPYPHDCS